MQRLSRTAPVSLPVTTVQTERGNGSEDALYALKQSRPPCTKPYSASPALEQVLPAQVDKTCIQKTNALAAQPRRGGAAAALCEGLCRRLLYLGGCFKVTEWGFLSPWASEKSGEVPYTREGFSQ